MMPFVPAQHLCQVHKLGFVEIGCDQSILTGFVSGWFSQWKTIKNRNWFSQNRIANSNNCCFIGQSQSLIISGCDLPVEI